MASQFSIILISALLALTSGCTSTQISKNDLDNAPKGFSDEEFQQVQDALDRIPKKTEAEKEDKTRRCKMLSDLVRVTYKNKLDGVSLLDTKKQLYPIWMERIDAPSLLDAQTEYIYLTTETIDVIKLEEKAIYLCTRIY